jgi:hypothetical protein
MSDDLGFYALIIAGITFLAFSIHSANKEEERCEAVGGHIVSVYKGSLCVRDGLIVEDY